MAERVVTWAARAGITGTTAAKRNTSAAGGSAGLTADLRWGSGFGTRTTARQRHIDVRASSFTTHSENLPVRKLSTVARSGAAGLRRSAADGALRGRGAQTSWTTVCVR